MTHDNSNVAFALAQVAGVAAINIGRATQPGRHGMERINVRELMDRSVQFVVGEKNPHPMLGPLVNNWWPTNRVVHDWWRFPYLPDLLNCPSRNQHRRDDQLAPECETLSENPSTNSTPPTAARLAAHNGTVGASAPMANDTLQEEEVAPQHMNFRERI